MRLLLIFIFAALGLPAERRHAHHRLTSSENVLIEGLRPKVAVYVHRKTKGQTNRAILYGSQPLKFK